MDIVSASASALLPLPGCATYFQRLHEGFERAAARGASDHFFRIAGDAVQVRCAGESVTVCLRALEHLRIAPAIPRLTLCLADEASTGCAPPAMPMLSGESFQHGEAWHLQDESGEVWCYQAESGVGALDTGSSTGIYWISDARALPQHVVCSPLLRLFHWWFSSSGRLLIHAAAIGFESGGVLLTGKSGAGKSTSAIACLDSPLRHASDDHCVVSTGPAPRAYSLYNSTRMHWSNPIRAGLPGAPSPFESEEKALYFLHDTCPDKLLPEFPVRAVLIPRATGLRDTVLRRISAAQAFLAAAPCSVMQLPGEERQACSRIGGLFRQVPCYTLEAGTDLSQIPRVIINFLRAS